MLGLNIAWRDLLLSILLVLFAMVLLAKPTDPQDLFTPPGNLFVYTTWSDIGGDVDTWMIGPKMGQPIGYDNKDSVTCNLVKDDLGTTTSSNYENIFCRDIPDGEYVINVYSYGVKTLPLTVSIQVVMMINGNSVLLFDEKVTLTDPKQEITVIRFKIKDGKVVPDSVHHTFVSLVDFKGV